MYAWTKELETGNAIIDKEHKELINAINSLLDACSKGQGRAKIDETLKFLNDYIIKHFSHEEQLQQSVKYTDFPNHKRYHEQFKKSVSQIVSDYQKDGATIALVGKVNQVIAGWLIDHIKREDTKVAAFVKSVQK